MRISDWSSDVCSSDLPPVAFFHPFPPPLGNTNGGGIDARSGQEQTASARQAGSPAAATAAERSSAPAGRRQRPRPSAAIATLDVFVSMQTMADRPTGRPAFFVLQASAASGWQAQALSPRRDDPQR